MLDVIKELLGDVLDEEELASIGQELGGRYVPRSELEEQQSMVSQRDAHIAELEGQIRQVQLDAVVDRALTKAGARNTRAVRALLELGGLAVENGVAQGLDEQIAALKESDGYLFEQEAPYALSQSNFARGNAVPDESGLTYSQAMRLRKGILS